MIEENSENRSREDNNNNKEDKINVKRRDMMRRCYILGND